MPILRTASLSHHYPDGRAALSAISLSVEAGETIAIVGPNGAGKTTLFLRLCGVLTGPHGQAEVNGIDPADPSRKRDLPASIGIVFQNPDDQLFCPTVFDDVAFGPINLGRDEADVRRRVTEALAAVGLSGFEDRVPFTLSGGEKRRAAIASVLSMHPAILLFDEPTAHLDPVGRRELIVLLRSLSCTKLIATHDLDFALDLCPRVIVLDSGELHADGPAAEILANGERMARHGLEVPWRLRESPRLS